MTAVKIFKGFAIIAALALTAACQDREVILTGERLDVRAGLATDTAAPANVARAITLPAPQALADWPQPGGNAQHYTAHAALNMSSLAPLWSVDIGTGENRRQRITAAPVVAGGRVFTLDAASHVMAHSTAGAPLWSADLTPPLERNEDATGGGLAFGEGKIFATTGFGALVALDAATGRQLWVQKTEAAVTGAPAYRDGLVYLVSRDNRAWVIDAATGRVQWQLPGTPSPASMVGGAAPALTDRLAIFPFGSSELVATLRKSGVRVWGSVVSGQRRGAAYASVTDISGNPVVAGNRVYVATPSGRTAALDVTSGERLWTADDGAYSPVLPVGGSVFMVSDQAELIRLDAGTGARIWAVKLPYFVNDRPKKFKAVHSHFGPLLAGGRLIVASDDGLIRFFAADSGALVGSVALPGGAAADPVVAGGVLYVVTAHGQLHAFR